MVERRMASSRRRCLAVLVGCPLLVLVWSGAQAAVSAGDSCETLAVNLGMVLNDQAQWAVDSQVAYDAAEKWYAQGSDAYSNFNAETADVFTKLAANELAKSASNDVLQGWVQRFKEDLLAIDETLNTSIAQRGGRQLSQAEAQQLKTLLAAKLRGGAVGVWAEKYVLGMRMLEGAEVPVLYSDAAEMIVMRVVNVWDLYVAASAVNNAQLMQRGLGERQRAILNRVTALKQQTIGTGCTWPSDFETEWQLASGQGVTTGDPLANLAAKVQSIRHSLETELGRCAAGRQSESHGPSIAAAGAFGGLLGGVFGAVKGGNVASIERDIAIGAGLGAGAALAMRTKAYASRAAYTGTDVAVCSQLDSERKQIDRTLAGLVNGTDCRSDNYSAELSCAYQMRNTMPTFAVTLQTILKSNQRICVAIGATLKPKKPAAKSVSAGLERNVMFPTQESIDSCVVP